MTEWGVVGVVVALVGFLAATAGPLLKLNGAITRLTVAVEGFQKSLDKLDSENRLTVTLADVDLKQGLQPKSPYCEIPLDLTEALAELE